MCYLYNLKKTSAVINREWMNLKDPSYAHCQSTASCNTALLVPPHKALIPHLHVSANFLKKEKKLKSWRIFFSHLWGVWHWLDTNYCQNTGNWIFALNSESLFCWRNHSLVGCLFVLAGQHNIRGVGEVEEHGQGLGGAGTSTLDLLTQ